MIAPLHRRHFMATASAAVATSTALSPAVHAAVNAAHAPCHILGIAPSSQKLPQLASDYQRGVELGLALANAPQVKLTWLSAGPLPAAPARAVEAALRHWPIDAVMGWIPPLLEKKLSAITVKAGVPLWISDSGADITPTTEHHPLRVRHSLELCAMASALADKVHAQCGPRAFLSMGWHESGYDFVQTFQHRWRSLGGQVVGRHVAGLPEQSQEFDGLKQAIAFQQPDVVVALFSGSQSHRFTQWWQAQSALARIELAGFPWLSDGIPNTRMWTVASWPSADTADSAWRAHFEKAGLAWTPGALLGAEAGASLGSALAAPSNNARDLWASLRASPLSGPRGERLWATAASDSIGTLWVTAEPRNFRHSTAWLQCQAYPSLSASAAAHSGWTTGYFLT
ncbi:ABC transporter substrate-binding protein [Acidovorax sp. DW039]|uniref:hypothetical protein n=1 Tax=Acidovorax sp. DW039 TaxID=3095606 RepID=UPI00308B9931|nr:ABC transporter substrate-binding protein [Acidovorax sp. DW039]